MGEREFGGGELGGGEIGGGELMVEGDPGDKRGFEGGLNELGGNGGGIIGGGRVGGGDRNIYEGEG